MSRTVEPLEKLGQICQKPRYKEVGNWMVRHWVRDAALPITWLLLHTEVTANQVTVFSLVVGLAGISLFAFASPVPFLLGTMLLQLWYLLDHVDGQIARYRKTACLSGRFLDFVTHHIIHGTIFFSLGLYGFRMSGSTLFVIWGFTTSLCILLFNLINDTKHKTFFEALGEGRTYRFREEKGSSRTGAQMKGKTLPRKIFSFLHKLVEVHVLMNILTVASFCQVFWLRGIDFRLLLQVFYGILLPVLSGVKIGYLVTSRKIDEEFRTHFHEVKET